MCPLSVQSMDPGMLCVGIKIFLLVWIIFVPVAMTSRLERIIDLLKEKK